MPEAGDSLVAVLAVLSSDDLPDSQPVVSNPRLFRLLRFRFGFKVWFGFGSVAITLDADGQHAPADIPAFRHAYELTRSPVIVGNRMGDVADMPWIRRLVNRFMSYLLSRTMGQYVPDTQCGYRLYHRSAFPNQLFDPHSHRFAAESEILLRLSLQGRKIGAVPIQTIYGNEKSKVRPVADTLRFLLMLHRFRKIKKESLAS